jgi:hypothetical protein
MCATHFVQDVQLQGLKPNSLSFLFGPTKVVPWYKAKTQQPIELLSLNTIRWVPRYVETPLEVGFRVTVSTPGWPG